MKKHLLILALLTSGVASAQTWSENFDSPTAPALPTGWFQKNRDAKTVVTNLNVLNFGTNAWVTSKVAAFPDMTSHVQYVVSTSWYNPTGISDDWLITPKFNVPAGAAMKWDAIAGDPGFKDGYLVKISITDTAVASFTTTLLTVAAEEDVWTTRGIDLSAYAGKDVHIAFINNSNDKFLLGLDNIAVLTPPTLDGSVKSITGLTTYSTGTSQTIAGVFANLGITPAADAVINYSVNGGTPVTQTFTFSPSLNYYTEKAFSFTTNATLSQGRNAIKVWVSKVNGTNETNNSNDTAKAVVYVASKSVARNALLEEFTSSTCGPCATLNANFDPLVNGNNPNTGGRLNVIKNQVNWPAPGNDASYNADSRDRVNFYKVNAAPTSLMNAKEMAGHTQADLDKGKNEPAYADITATLTNNGTNVTGSCTVTPYVSVADAGRLVIHQVLLQNFYVNPGATTSQKNYYHVMRKMFPTSGGTDITTVDGTNNTANFTHNATIVTTPAQNSYDFWTATPFVYEYVVFVQDKITQDILQSASARSDVGVVEFKNNNQIGVYPSPAVDFAVVGIKLENSSTVDISIFDLSGKLVYQLNGSKVAAGSQEIIINTASFESGVYSVVVRTDKGILKDKVVIAK